mmetsp:Transcript_5671/g.17989  ORF Transcript_5671/g.17989 Transcript_5671/m.17989 type:complete len:245 (-) Transcript_5671:686-1420(-)
MGRVLRCRIGGRVVGCLRQRLRARCPVGHPQSRARALLLRADDQDALFGLAPPLGAGGRRLRVDGPARPAALAAQLGTPSRGAEASPVAHRSRLHCGAASRLCGGPSRRPNHAGSAFPCRGLRRVSAARPGGGPAAEASLAQPKRSGTGPRGAAGARQAAGGRRRASICGSGRAARCRRASRHPRAAAACAVHFGRGKTWPRRVPTRRSVASGPPSAAAGGRRRRRSRRSQLRRVDGGGAQHAG